MKGQQLNIEMSSGLAGDSGARRFKRKARGSSFLICWSPCLCRLLFTGRHLFSVTRLCKLPDALRKCKVEIRKARPAWWGYHSSTRSIAVSVIKQALNCFSKGLKFVHYLWCPFMPFTMVQIIWQQVHVLGDTCGGYKAPRPSASKPEDDRTEQWSHLAMSSSFYIESLIQQNSKAKTLTSNAESARRTYDSPVPCSCCWTPSSPDPSGLCQLCIPSAPSVHPFMHVRSAATTTGFYSARELSKDHPHLPPHYPVSESERLHIASYGNYRLLVLFLKLILYTCGSHKVANFTLMAGLAGVSAEQLAS